MIFLLKGRRGRGKTFGLTAISKSLYSSWNIIANYQIKGITFYPTKEILKMIDNDVLSNCLILLDEAQLFFDSRNWKSAGNKDVGYWIAQIRKRNIHIGMTAQYVDNLEKRIRQHIDLVGVPYLKYPYLAVTWFDLSRGEESEIVKPHFVTYHYVSGVHKLYNTMEVAQ